MHFLSPFFALYAGLGYTQAIVIVTIRSDDRLAGKQTRQQLTATSLAGTANEQAAMDNKQTSGSRAQTSV